MRHIKYGKHGMRNFKGHGNVEIGLSDSVLFDHILKDHPEHYILIGNAIGEGAHLETFYLGGITQVPSNPIRTMGGNNRIRYYGWIESVGKS